MLTPMLGLQLAVAFAQVGTAPDSLVRVSLAEALERSARVDPSYVSATRQMADAGWGRRAAIAAFIVPAITTQISATRYSSESFNIGTGNLASNVVDARLDGRLNLFSGFSKINNLTRANALVQEAEANEIRARFTTALLTETDYYDVIAQRELTRVAAERLRRANEQFAVARARVLAGAAVMTDSLQLLLEVRRADVALLRQRASLRVSRFQLARRIGSLQPVDATDENQSLALTLPLSEADAVREAVEASPEALMARASLRAAEARVRSIRGSYLPRIDLVGSVSAFDDSFFPTAVSRSSIGLVVRLPLWDNAVREINSSLARSERDIQRALTTDIELALRRDVVQAYETFETASAATALASQSVDVAEENLRVQEDRYRAGAALIIDLIAAQVSLSEAEVELVQARFASRLALSGLEAILGRRLF